MSDNGGETFVVLVQQKQIEIACESAAGGEHLLLAAGKRGPFLPPAFLEPREELVDAFVWPAGLARNAGEVEVFLDGHAGYDAPVFRYELNAAAGEVVDIKAARQPEFRKSKFFNTLVRDAAAMLSAARAPGDPDGQAMASELLLMALARTWDYWIARAGFAGLCPPLATAEAVMVTKKEMAKMAEPKTDVLEW